MYIFKSSNRNPLQFNCIWTFYTHKCKPKNSEREVKTRDTLRICGLQFPTNNQVQIIISSLCTFGQRLHTWLKSDAKRWSRLISEHKCSKHFSFPLYFFSDGLQAVSNFLIFFCWRIRKLRKNKFWFFSCFFGFKTMTF